jgi:uncharacterized membrane protein YphA (DoxX/SURF4 family)
MGERWSLFLRVAFRFCFLYFGLFCVFNQPLGSFFPMLDIDSFYTFWPLRQIVFWVAAHIFHADLPLVYTGSGSGDKVYDWVFIVVLVAFSAAGTVVWSILDRKRENYATTYTWFRLFIRFMLASQLIVYGLAKLIPEQMPYPSLFRLVEPYGNFSPMGVLWASIGATPAYEMFAGSAELLAGILLIFPRTTMLGALIAAADMAQVFTLNMTYDVPVKILSFNLLLLALFLLAPDLRRIADFFVLNSAVPRSNQFPLFESPRWNRIALAAQIVLGAYLVAVWAYFGWAGWFKYGGGAPKSPLYGIWNVDNVEVDGKPRALLVTDHAGWRRVIFYHGVGFQHMDDSFARYGASIDLKKGTIALTNPDDAKWRASFAFHRIATDRMTIDGTMDNHKLHMRLSLVDASKFLLVSRGFHWIQDYPYNR